MAKIPNHVAAKLRDELTQAVKSGRASDVADRYNRRHGGQNSDVDCKGCFGAGTGARCAVCGGAQ